MQSGIDFYGLGMGNRKIKETEERKVRSETAYIRLRTGTASHGEVGIAVI